MRSRKQTIGFRIQLHQIILAFLKTHFEDLQPTSGHLVQSICNNNIRLPLFNQNIEQ
jgi:hypothetical protein